LIRRTAARAPCTRKDRARRYATPSELAADIQRYLRNEPVIAHAPSTEYRARKYIRRHRLGVVVVAAAAVLLLGFAIAQAVQLRRISRERDRADRISAFMTGMFKVSDPSEARGNSVTAGRSSTRRRRISTPA
jgi:hypothetical protein